MVKWKTPTLTPSNPIKFTVKVYIWSVSPQEQREKEKRQ